jgi:uncharacterized membrane protein
MTQGTSGGVSVIGSLAALFGSIAVSAIGFMLSPQFTISTFALVALLGFVGSLIDSLIGDLWQSKYISENGEKSDYEDANFTQKAGIDWLNNDMVNFFSGLLIVAIAILVFAL